MIKTKEVKVKWNPKNREHYLSKGYEFTTWHDEITVPIHDLPESAHAEIELECDYCGEDFTKRYSKIKRIEKTHEINKHACSECKKMQRKDSVLVKSIKESAIQELSENIYSINVNNQEVYLKQCDTCLKLKEVSCYRKSTVNISLDMMYANTCKECEKDYKDLNKHKLLLSYLKITSSKKNLDISLTENQLIKIIDKFDNQCTLTGSVNFVYEHFIPISWGHGGTHKGNIYLLSQELNSSKGNLNPFKWIKRSDVRRKVDMRKWNKLIKYLADKNRLTVRQFEAFIYWCEENKRKNVKKGAATSLDQWKKSIEK